MHDPFLKPVFADPRMAEILIGLRASCSGVLEADREDLGPADGVNNPSESTDVN